MTDHKGIGRLKEYVFIDRLLVRRNIRKTQSDFVGTMLDIGCGEQPYKHEFKHIDKYISIDRDKADIVHDLTKFPYPLATETIDTVLCTFVIDDIFDKEAFVQEINRLLTSNGRLIMSVSFVWELHDLPYDYGRPSSEFLRLLLERNGFESIEIYPIGNSWTTLGQVLNLNLGNLMVKNQVKRRSWLRLISPVTMANSLFFHGLGLLLHNRATELLPMGFYLTARKRRTLQ